MFAAAATPSPNVVAPVPSIVRPIKPPVAAWPIASLKARLVPADRFSTTAAPVTAVLFKVIVVLPLPQELVPDALSNVTSVPSGSV